MNHNATPAQLGRIERILTDNDLHSGDYDRLWAILEAARIDERTPGDGTPMPQRQASATITWLQDHGYWPKGERPGGHPQRGERSPFPKVPAGYYATTAPAGTGTDFWRVEVPAAGKWAGCSFVQRVIGGHADTAVRGAQARAALEAITAAGTAAAARRYAGELGRCARCNLHLTDGPSRALGLGRDCAEARGMGEQWLALSRQLKAPAA